jgi:sphinganine C4-monooxygenase
VAMLVLDAWQYFMHRLMHSSTYMYRRFHSWHHRVAAPYAFAAQYGHPVDAVLTETLSGAAAYLASGMSPRAAAAFFVFATVKGVEPAARGVCQQHGVPRRAPPARRRRRRNFSQPFFVVWDRILGTHATPVVLRRRGGSLEVKVFEERLK